MSTRVRCELVVVAAMAIYAWVTAGVPPFSALSYVLIAIPSVAFVVAYARMGGLSRDNDAVSSYYQQRSDTTTFSNVAPWTALLVAAIVLELIGLCLGGRSASVPTLSTTVDHLLARRWERSTLCFAWLLAGAVPLLRLRRLRVQGR